MKSLPRPTGLDVEVAYKALARSNARIAKRIRTDWPYLRGRFRSYEAICADVTASPSAYRTKPTVKRAFEQLYAHPPLSVRPLKDVDALRAMVECPYCGGVNSPETFDHFLEKAVFPEFSLFPLNLVPVCRGCNPSRTSIVGSTVSKINPYLTDLASRLTLGCDIDVSATPAVFGLTADMSGLTAAEATACIAHMDYLKLNGRFKKFAAQEWDRYRRLFAGTTRAIVRRHLRDEIRSYAGFSKNYWKPIVYAAMIVRPDTIDALRAL